MSKVTEKHLEDVKGAERDPLLRRLGERITALRKSRSWARAHLARRLGVPCPRVAHWERGDNQPPLAMLLALSRLLEVSIEELAGAEPVLKRS